MNIYRMLRIIFPGFIWKMKTSEKVIYLTFDDGPVPVVTPWVLEMLHLYNARATFFCVGKNVLENIDIYNRILQQGHSAGNHTWQHLNAWTTSSEEYIMDISRASQFIDSALFRPPYGRLRYSIVKKLEGKFKIVMWDCLSRDYDQSLNGKQCAERVLKHAGNGSIVVFHDSLKAEERLRIALPAVLKYFSDNNYQFKTISHDRDF
jgi:peptidoglycan/xylan/chitin deacetylase (PgdA/CDA1 family)